MVWIGQQRRRGSDVATTESHSRKHADRSLETERRLYEAGRPVSFARTDEHHRPLNAVDCYPR